MRRSAQAPVGVALLTALALIGFAANSVLCRRALADPVIDAASFTAVRLLSGAAVLLLIHALTARRAPTPSRGDWSSALMLFLYAIAFSFAYVSLDTGTGALVLFAAVQLTIVAVSIFNGERLHRLEWFGLLLAFIGFVYLVLPSVTTPSFVGFVLMTIAGVAWGIYTLRGRGSVRPLADTTVNFVRTTPFVIVLVLVALPFIRLSTEGILLAVASGAIASGIGYTLWYMALGGLSATLAAVVQLAVPVIAALGGVVFVAEPVTGRLALSAVMVLGGILTVVLGRYAARTAAGAPS